MNRYRSRPQWQQGLATVEFAIVGLLTLIFIFGALEFGRGLYVANSLTEGTRRGARLAAVCPLNHPAIRNVAVFYTPDGNPTGAGFADLTPGDVTLEYLDGAGTATASVNDVRYVRASIVGYELRLFIPLIEPRITLPDFSTTLPAESLGFNPDNGNRSCFGS